MRNKNDCFKAEATYFNMSTNILFFAFISLLLTYYAWKSNGWTSLAKLFLIIAIVLFTLTVIVFFSKLSIREIVIDNDTISVGKRTYDVKNIKKIECIAIGRTFHVHIKQLDQSLTLRIKEPFRIPMRNYVMKWCNRHQIEFIEK